MRALIDGDIILYRVGFGAENETEGIAKYRAAETVDGILEFTKATEYELFFSDSLENGFRVQVYPQYNQSRRNKPKPAHYNMLKEYFLVEWGGKIALEQEADDALGIAQTSYNLLRKPEDPDSIICTIDKDLQQIPGKHYNFVTKQFWEVSEFEGLHHFYAQLLEGDRGQDIPGIWKIGPLMAEKILQGCKSERDMFFSTVDAYKKWLEKEWKGEWDSFKENQMLDMILMYGVCLKIRREENEIWTFPPDTLIAPQLEGLKSVYIH